MLSTSIYRGIIRTYYHTMRYTISTSTPRHLLLLSVYPAAIQLERRRLKAVAGELERAFEEVRTRATQTEERRVQAEMLTAEALKASTSARKEKELVQLRSAEVEQVARLQETERTSTAQARAQSATELSTSRRLKAELARAVALQERQTRGDVNSYGFVQRQNSGDMGAGTGVGFNRLGIGGGPPHSMQDVPSKTTVEPGAVSLVAFTCVERYTITTQIVLLLERHDNHRTSADC